MVTVFWWGREGVVCVFVVVLQEEDVCGVAWWRHGRPASGPVSRCLVLVLCWQSSLTVHMKHEASSESCRVLGFSFGGTWNTSNCFSRQLTIQDNRKDGRWKPEVWRTSINLQSWPWALESALQLHACSLLRRHMWLGCNYLYSSLSEDTDTRATLRYSTVCTTNCCWTRTSTAEGSQCLCWSISIHCIDFILVIYVAIVI